MLVVADPEEGFFSSGRLSAEYPMRMLWKKGFIRLLLVGGVVWMMLILSVLLVHIWSCQSSIVFFSGIIQLYFYGLIKAKGSLMFQMSSF